MGVALVHGNPETSAIWDPLRAALDRDDVTCLSPPGFGAPVPAGWRATVEEYRDWLIAELTALGSPVDLVGHDWGGAHAVMVAMARPDLLRSWCTDVIGVFDPEYVWHELAQVWQTSGAGEQAVAERCPRGGAADGESRCGGRATGSYWLGLFRINICSRSASVSWARALQAVTATWDVTLEHPVARQVTSLSGSAPPGLMVTALALTCRIRVALRGSLWMPGVASCGAGLTLHGILTREVRS